MTDISTWSPLDESNTAAPPAGAPENMATNLVNNTMRAMMGATRRWYDELAAGTATIAYMPLSGGVLTGPLSSYSSITCNGALQAGGTITGLGDIVAANNITGGTLTATVTISAATLYVTGVANMNADLGVAGTVYAHAFADTDGVVLVLDVLRDLQARVARLEGGM